MSVLLCYTRQTVCRAGVLAFLLCLSISVYKVRRFEKEEGPGRSGRHFLGRLLRGFGNENSLRRSSHRLSSPLSMEQVDADSRTTDSGHYVITKGSSLVAEAVSRRAAAGIQTPQILIWRSQDCLEANKDVQLEFLLAKQCGGCQVTTDRSALNTSVAVVLFNRADILEDLPDQSYRRQEQAYVFWSRETPSKTFWHKSTIANSPVDSWFNLTMYFRRDSDVLQLFGNREMALRRSKELETKGQLNEILRNKTKLAVWVVSNCYGIHGATSRMAYARELRKSGLNFDVFGDCFKRKYDGPVVKGFREYKFYLAFENSIHCPDYVTEKFWRNSLHAGLVPVVFGPTKRDVFEIAPKDSYIHIEDFSSPSELAQYLMYLDSNHTAYMQYHNWRKKSQSPSISLEEISKGHQAGFCRLCKREVLEKHPHKVIPSVTKWLYETRFVDGECLRPKDELSDQEKASLTNWAR